MIYSLHENNRDNSFKGNQGESVNFCQKRSRSLDRVEGSCIIACIGRAETGMDCSGLRSDTHECKPMDSRCKGEGDTGFSEQISAWASFPIDPFDSSTGRTTPGAISPSVWIKPCTMGWSDFSGSLEATFWDKAESPSGSELDAPVRLPPETSQLCVSTSQGRRSKEVPKDFKKNLIHFAIHAGISPRIKCTGTYLATNSIRSNDQSLV